MKDHGCCVVTASGSGRQTVENRNSDGDRPTRKFVRRFLSIAEWIIPGVMLALLASMLAGGSLFVLRRRAAILSQQPRLNFGRSI